MRDIVIIGAGVTGSAVARELSRYQYDVLVVEANSDVCEGTSKANSGIVHAGFDTEPGSMMAKMNIRGNEMMEQLSKDLDFPFKRNGSLVLCFDEKDMDQLVYLLEKGQKNGVPGLRIITKEEVKEMEEEVKEELREEKAKENLVSSPRSLSIRDREKILRLVLLILIPDLRKYQ